MSFNDRLTLFDENAKEYERRNRKMKVMKAMGEAEAESSLDRLKCLVLLSRVILRCRYNDRRWSLMTRAYDIVDVVMDDSDVDLFVKCGSMMTVYYQGIELFKFNADAEASSTLEVFWIKKQLRYDMLYHVWSRGMGYPSSHCF